MTATLGPPTVPTTGVAAYLAGRDVELARLVEATRENELTIISSSEPALAAALADACSALLSRDERWAVIRADARVADDVTDFARAIARAAANTIADVSVLAIDEAFETPEQGRARLDIRRALGPRAYALAADAPDGPEGESAVSAATQAVVALRKRQNGRVLMVLHGIDEFVRPGRNRFDDGRAALWALRGVWQKAHGAALLTGGVAVAAMAADPEQGFYGYGQLHEVRDLPDDRLSDVYRDALGSRADESAVAEARGLLAHAVWLVPELVQWLPARGPVEAPDVREAWSEMLRSREATLQGLLRTASRVHRFAVPVLKALASGDGPYARLRRRGLTPSDVSRALLALESHALIYRLGDAQWRVADPTLAALVTVGLNGAPPTARD